MSILQEHIPISCRNPQSISLDMSEFLEFNFQTFRLSGKDHGLSLSVSSNGFISNFPDSLERKDVNIPGLVESGDLWLRTPGFSEFQIIIAVDGEYTSSHAKDSGFLEGIAEAICQCTVRITSNATAITKFHYSSGRD